jgi:Virulence factor BrkB
MLYPAHAVGDHVRAEEQYPPGHNRRTFHHRFPWCYRIFFLLVLVLFGLHLLAAGSGAGSGANPTGQQRPSGQTRLVSGHGIPLQVGLGAGATSGGMTNASIPVATCLNPLDATCWLQNAAQWMAQQIMNALQPVIGAILHNPLNILTQTPPADTYQNPTVITWWQSFLAVVDLALASLIVIGGYNVVVGRHLGLPHSELAEFLPRLLLAFGAAHFSLFIDLENALNLVALNLAGTSMLTNIINALFQGNLATEGLLVWVLMFVLGVMAILLGAQMAIRLALLWVLLEMLFVIVPNQHISFRDSWLGALLAAIAIQAYLQLFPFYATHFLRGYTGTVGFAIIFLFFFYYFGVILLAGAEINAFYAQGKRALPENLAVLVHDVTQRVPKGEQEVQGL